jgi:hypothetical protein
VDRALADGGAFASLLADVEQGRVDPYTAISEIHDRWERWERLRAIEDPSVP